MFSKSFVQKYLVPGFVFQSITIGGGYGTGRELVEFFLTEGPLSGLLGMLVTLIVWSVVIAISFELARVTKSYNYRTFVKSYLGRFWFLYEIVYLSGLILVISVMGSAAGSLLQNMTGLPEIIGIVLMILIVGFMSYYGTSLIERALASWSVALYVAFAVLIVVSIYSFGGQIFEIIENSKTNGNWLSAGVRYAGYNMGIIPAMVFVVQHLETRKEAMLSGALAGLIAIIPGVFIYLAMLIEYPAILDESIPIDRLLTRLDIQWFGLIFRIILFGTFIETGLGIIHGFNERIASIFEEKGKVMPARLRLILAIVILFLAIFVADYVGIIDLIASGYGTLTWGYIAVFVAPVIGLGVYRIWRE